MQGLSILMANQKTRAQRAGLCVPFPYRSSVTISSEVATEKLKIPVISERLCPRLAAIACVVFFLTGLGFLSHFGLQNDEALFAYGIYEPTGGVYTYPAGSHAPLMLMRYLGTLKSWLYMPIFAVAGAGTLSTRVPMLLAGAISIWLFYQLLRRISGGRAAVVGAVLLATDSIYLLTTSLDWGPVALQHLLLIGGILLLLRFYQEGREFLLAFGFLLFGLAVWDKALAIWMLSGIGIASLVTFPRQIIAVTRFRRVAIAVLAFGIGALPLVVYNLDHQFDTFRGNSFTTKDLYPKAVQAAKQLEGGVLFGWLTEEAASTPIPRRLSSSADRAGQYLSDLTGHPRRSLMLAAFVASLLLAGLARGRELRAILFALVAMAVAWLQMGITENAGFGAHHIVLLWPFPHLVIAVSLAAASRRLPRAGTPVLAAALAVVAFSNLAVMNEYHLMMRRYGGALNWNSSINELSRLMQNDTSTAIFCMDWGILDSLRLLNHGQLPLRVGTEPLVSPDPSAADRQRIREFVSDGNHVFIAHSAGMEFMPGMTARLAKLAGEMGYERDTDAIIVDGFGRRVFEIYRFHPAGVVVLRPETLR